MTAVIELRGVGKRYRKLEEHERMLRSVLPLQRPSERELWALQDIDLTVSAGEVLGVIGRNGAGKTTLLRLLAGVTTPTVGRVTVRGRIAPLISLGVGFHQEMSGRENVLVNGLLLGLSAREVARRFDAIVDFAELTEFIDTPVKFYSSGMTMRLGFSVVVHVDPTVLLVDEILAVGDASFQLKCLDRLRALQQQGAAIVMVSHAMHQVRQLCPRALLILQGQVAYDGEVERAIALHYRGLSASEASGPSGTAIEILGRWLLGGEGEDHHANYDQSMEMRMRLRFHCRVRRPEVEFGIDTDSGLAVTRHTAALDPSGGGYRAGEEVELRIGFQAKLGGGNYRLLAHLRDGGGQSLGGCGDLVLFVAGRPGSLGVIDLRATIEIDGADRTDHRVTLLEA